MKQRGKGNRRLLAGLLGAAALMTYAACAGSSAASPVAPDPGEQALPLAEQLDSSDLPPSPVPGALTSQTPSTQSPALPQGPSSSSGVVEPQQATNAPQAVAAQGGTDGGTQTEYTWQDGDRALTVTLQADLVVDEDASTKGAAGASPGGAIVKAADAQGQGTGQPVFKSQSGALMTLPGGVLLVLDPEWTQTEINAFFSSNGIKLDSVTELDFLENGFFVETEAGFPSLDLANSLATKDGVILSSPNWWTEVTVR